MSSTDPTGRLLAGRYRLEAELGTGSSAQVWRAFDSRLSRRVAVKLLHPGLAADEGFLRRFRAEAQIVAQLNHRHVLRVFDWGEDSNGAYLVSEYLSGGSLRDIYDRGTHLSLEQVVAIGIAASHGLAYAHRRGLVHRDIKPANLLFDEEAEVRIADFGLARALAEAAWTEPAGTVLGTARYASPEQAEGLALDGRSDVYSLALVLYEAVTRHVPFAQDTTLATLSARIGQRLPPARALGALYPILSEAAIADPLARLEAAELAVELELLAAMLPRPERLPIARASEAALTETGLLGVFGAEEAGERAAPPPSPLAVATEPLERPDDTLLAATSAPPTPLAADVEQRPRRRGRRVLLPLLVLVVLAVAALGADRVLLAKKTVPNVLGSSLASATRAIASAGLSAHEAPRTYSLAVPAGDVVSEQPKAGSKLKGGAEVRIVLSAGPRPVALPKLAGSTLRAAEAALTSRHLGHRVERAYEEQIASGVVVSSTPASGSVAYGSQVELLVSRGPRPRTIPGGLVASSWQAAGTAIDALRLVAVEQLVYSTATPAGTVISTSPASGTSGVAVGSKVEVTVSKGPPYVVVPPVEGLPIESAVAALRSAGLDVTEVIGPPFATTAVTTSPAAGQSVVSGSSVLLYAS